MSGQVQTYTPSVAPISDNPDVRALTDYIQQQLQLISQSLVQTPLTQQVVLHVAPAKPREGMIVIADGTDWNPGNGAGQYTYIGGGWVYNGNIAQDLSGYLTKADNLASVASASAALANLAGAPLASPALTGNPTAPTQAPGTNNTRLATTAYADSAVAALVVTGRLVAGTPLVQDPLAINSILSQAHGLGQKPDFIRPYVECKSADSGYNAGDRIQGSLLLSTPTIWCSLDATNTYANTSNNPMQVMNRTTNTFVAGTLANWKLVVIPYKLT